MRRREFTILFSSAAAWPLVVRAQEPLKVPTIGFLGAESASTDQQQVFDAFREGMREHGYVEGKNVTFVERWAEGRSERFPKLVGELLGLKVNVIVAISAPAALAAKRGTATIPVVFVASDPLGSGLVASLARPAENLTGFSVFLGDEFSSKWLEFLRQAVPSISRVAVLWNPTNPASSHYLNVLQRAAEKMGIKLQPQLVNDPVQFESAFADMVAAQAQALVVVVDPLTLSYRQRIVELTINNRLPTMYGVREFVEVGGLMAYGVHLLDLYRRAATYVDKILKGAKPSDLPVEQPTKFEFVINAKTAKTLGLTIPPTLLVFADEVIE